MTGLLPLLQTLSTATDPAQVFGTLAGTPEEKLRQLKTAFRALALVAHPDRVPPADRGLAEATFKLLETWRRRAEETLRDPGVPITTPHGMVLMHELLGRGDAAAVYRCTRGDERLELKLALDPRCNDLLENEAECLEKLAGPYFPRLIDRFLTTDGSVRRRALVMAPLPRPTAAELRAAYPAGLDPRDAAWIFNRLLEALWFTHRAGLVHGAVLPPNLHLDLERHGLVLAEWGFAGRTGLPLAAIPEAFAGWYPPEVFAAAGRGGKPGATAGLDIFLAARCLADLLGGDPLTGELPPGCPPGLQRFVRGCLVASAARRPADAGALREEFGDLLGRLYGRPRFRRLTMPGTAATETTSSTSSAA